MNINPSARKATKGQAKKIKKPDHGSG